MLRIYLEDLQFYFRILYNDTTFPSQMTPISYEASVFAATRR